MKISTKRIIKEVNSTVDSYLIKIVLLLLIYLPTLILLMYINSYGVNIILADQWQFVPLIEKLKTGSLNFFDLYAQHNEARMIFPRLFFLILGSLFNYDTNVFLYFSWSLSLIVLILLFIMYMKNIKNDYFAWIGFVPISWLLFSFRQFENQFWSFQICIYLAIFGFISSIYLLSQTDKINLKFLLAVVLGIISTYSFFNSLLLWPIGLVLILVSKKEHKKNMAVIWFVTSILIYSSYFINWRHPSYHPSVFYPFNHVKEAIEFFLVNMGAPFSFDRYLAEIFGVILLLIIIIFILLKINKHFIEDNVFWLSLLAFSIGTTIFCDFGRLGFGIDYALSSKYTSFTILGVIGIYAIISKTLISNIMKKSKDKISIIAYIIIIILLFIGIIIGYVQGSDIIKQDSAYRNTLYKYLVNYKTSSYEQLQDIYHTPSELKLYINILEKYNISIFKC